jgi:hypothetical protein
MRSGVVYLVECERVQSMELPFTHAAEAPGAQ